jgi:broad specificity phosphatase PhoE
MVMVHLVRHARSAQDPARPSWQWGLTEDAGVGTDRLRTAGVLPPRALWVSSSEPKARATAALLTTEAVQVDDALREAERDSAWLDPGEFEAAVLRSFADPMTSARPGWEPLSRTQARVMQAARRAVAMSAVPSSTASLSAGTDVVLVGHGTAWTLLVAGLTGSAPDIAAWQTMRMPDHCALNWPDASAPEGRARIASSWGAWDA